MVHVDRRSAWAAGSVAVAAAFGLAGYEFIRSASNTLFKNAYGADRLPLVMALIPVGVLLVVALYGRALSWLGPRRTLFWSALASALVIGAATLAVQAGWRPATVVLYVFREAYIVLLIEQYWSFINSTLGDAQARRLNGPITGVASIGAIAGGWALAAAVPVFGTAAMPLFAAASLLPAMIVSDLGYARAGEPTAAAHPRAGDATHLGLRQFRAAPVLVFLLLVVLAAQVVSTMLDLRFQSILHLAIPDADRQTAFSGRFFAGMNLLAAALQFVAAPLLLRVAPLRAVHVAIPCLHLLACAVLLGSPSLATAGAAYMLFKGLDYSVFRAAKELLYIPLSFDARFRAKELIDVFGYRFAKGGSALPFAAMKVAGAAVGGWVFSLIALVAAAAWTVLAVPMTRRRPSATDTAAGDAAAPR